MRARRREQVPIIHSSDEELSTIKAPSRSHRRRRLSALVAPIAVGAALLAAPAAQAAFGLVPGSFDGSVLRADGSAETRAGAHPYSATTGFALKTMTSSRGKVVTDGSLRNVDVDLPRGFVFDPSATPKCTAQQLNDYACPAATQVGVARVRYDLIGEGAIPDPVTLAVYNMVPTPNQPAQFAFKAITVVVQLQPAVRPGGDFGLTAKVKDASQGAVIFSSELEFFGVPADRNSSGSPRRALITNPTDCSTGPVRTHIKVESWEGDTDSAYFDSHLPAPDEDVLVGPTGCDQLAFDPDIAAEPTSTIPDTPTGLDFDLSIPQNDDPDGLATAHLKRAEVVLPEGMSVSPAAADGLGACAPAQIDLASAGEPSCPPSSKVGSVEIDTPLLEKPMDGSVYLAKQNDNPFNSLLALYIVARAPGIVIKLPGEIKADPNTGRLTTTFDNNPQLPFHNLRLSFNDGPRAPLATPPTCGEKTVTAKLSSWSGKTVQRQSTFTIACTPDLGGFSPSFTAGVVTPTAGAFSPFLLRASKPDGQSPLTGVSLRMPAGLLATLKGNVGAQIGTARVAAGPGSNPYWFSGPVVLEGPYGDAPFSLRVTVPAKAGPFDLGDVVVRQKIYVDAKTAQVSVVSDPLPTIVEGIPVRMQSLAVDVDKPGFMLNPTSCEEKRIAGALSSAAGQTVPVTTRFQVGDCPSLALKPKLKLALTGRKQLTDGRHPGLKATLTQGAKQSGLKKVAVKLPLSLALEPDNADGLCEFAESGKEEPNCPASSIVGRAKAWTPVLNRPLEGPVYFSKNVRIDKKSGRQIRTLPRLVIPLRGEVALNLIGDSDTKGGKLVNTFATVPDAPVSRFELTLVGGKKGILVVNGKACKRSRSAGVEIDGHNGKTADQTAQIAAPCGKAAKAKKAKRAARR